MPTTNAVPSADPSDLLFNAQKLDEVVNGSAESFIDRRGVQRLTLTGALRLIGFEAPVAFAAGLSITRSTQTVTNGVNTYHADPASLPFTTTSTFNGAQWRLASNVTTFDLAAYAVPLVGGAGTIEMAKLTTPVQNLINGALQRTGGTMTGALVLPGNAASALEAVPKQQLDASPGRLLAVRVFTTANTGQTYTPTAGTTSVIVQAVGGGGAGGGTVATGAAEVAVAGPGTSGSYGASRYTSGFSGAALTIGLGGASVVGANGGGGGTTSFGALLSCPGGVGGGAGGNASAGGSYANSAASAPAAASGANIYSIQGVPGVPTIWNASGSFVNGIGAGSPLGSGGINGSAPSGYGGGGGGKVVGAGAGATPGNAGASGAIIVWEYA